jgi:hypothetical protein
MESKDNRQDESWPDIDRAVYIPNEVMRTFESAYLKMWQANEMLQDLEEDRDKDNFNE